MHFIGDYRYADLKPTFPNRKSKYKVCAKQQEGMFDFAWFCESLRVYNLSTHCLLCGISPPSISIPRNTYSSDQTCISQLSSQLLSSQASHPPFPPPSPLAHAQVPTSMPQQSPSLKNSKASSPPRLPTPSASAP